MEYKPGEPRFEAPGSELDALDRAHETIEEIPITVDFDPKEADQGPAKLEELNEHGDLFAGVEAADAQARHAQEIADNMRKRMPGEGSEEQKAA